jgi:hypothetical protein
MIMARLPLRIDDSPAGPVILALCGAESAVHDPHTLDAPKREAVRDGSLAAVLRVVLRVKGCWQCQYLQEEVVARRAGRMALR